MMPIKRVDYDSENDILYVAFSSQSNSYGDEISNSVVIRRDWEDDSITGVTIFDFMSLLRDHSPEIFSLPFELNFEEQILPYCK